MKKKLKNKKRFSLSFLIGTVAVFFLFSCNNNKGKEEDMSGMDMEKNPSMNASHPDDKVLPTDVVISNQLTIHPIKDKKEIPVTAKGIVQFDERRNNNVSAYFGGRIEKLYVRYNYQYTTRGQRIMDIYSPELLTAQENYLFLLKSASEKNLIQKAKEQLQLFGLTEEQITHIEKSGNTFYSLPVFSTYEGYILFGKGNNKNSMSNVQSQNSTEMQSGKNMESAVKTNGMKSSENNEPELREGMYINKGQLLFTVNDFKSVWLMLSIEAKDASSVKLNDKVSINIDTSPDDDLEGKVDFIEPVVSDKEKFISVRVYADNSRQFFKNNSLIDAEITTKADSALWIPNSAVLDLGRKKIVWLKTGDYGKGKGMFISKDIETGRKTGEFTEIISGLSVKDNIIKVAGYMNDSETLIQ